MMNVFFGVASGLYGLSDDQLALVACAGALVGAGLFLALGSQIGRFRDRRQTGAQTDNAAMTVPHIATANRPRSGKREKAA